MHFGTDAFHGAAKHSQRSKFTLVTAGVRVRQYGEPGIVLSNSVGERIVRFQPVNDVTAIVSVAEEMVAQGDLADRVVLVVWVGRVELEGQLY